MKRATALLFLGIAVVALLIIKAGLFTQPAPSSPDTSVSPAPAKQPAASFSPVNTAPAPTSTTPAVPVSSSSALDTASLSETVADQVLRAWTYPGAANGATPVLGRKDPHQSEYMRQLVAYGSASDVWRFYQALAGVQPSKAPGAPATNPIFGGNPVVNDTATRSAAGITTATYTRTTKHYTITAFLLCQSGTNHTQINLRVFPRAAK